MENLVLKTMKKTHSRSFFVKTRLDSFVADFLIKDCPSYRGRFVKVFQIVVVNELEILVEIMYLKRLRLKEIYLEKKCLKRMKKMKPRKNWGKSVHLDITGEKVRPPVRRIIRNKISGIFWRNCSKIIFLE